MAEISYKTINNNNFMLLTCEEEGKNIETQINMLVSSEIPNFLPVSSTLKNGVRILQYDITSRTQLSGILERSKLSTVQFFALLSGAVSAMEQCRQYALSPCGVRLENDMIYLQQKNAAPQFVYQPTAQEGEPFQICAHWVQSMIASGSVVVDSSINQVLDAITSPGFTIAALKQIVGGVELSAVRPQRQPPVPAAAPGPQVPLRQAAPNPAPQAAPAAQPAGQMRREAAAPFTPPPSPPARPKRGGFAPPSPVARPVAARRKSAGKGAYPVKNLVLSGILLLFSAVLIAAGLLTDVTRLPDGGLDITKALGVVLLVGALNAMLLRKWLGGDQKIAQTEPQPPRQSPEPRRERTPSPVPAMAAAPVAENRAAPPPPARPFPAPAPAPAAPPPPQEDSDLTVMLDARCGCYLRAADGTETHLHTSPFRVGRDAVSVDQVYPDPTIGRYHAQFVEDGEGRWSVIDNNSRNHTYLNGTCLDPNTPYALNSGDVLQLAKTSLVFEQR